MSEVDKVFQGSIPQLYDAYLVPLIFEHYADDLAERVAAHAPAHVLETAAGSGVVTRALAPRLAADARYVVTDLNQPMLDHAAARQGADARISWQQADALALPFAAAEFDTLVCQFGVMFFPDKGAGFAEARRVLRGGGRFVFNVWDAIEFNEFADVVTAAAAALCPDDPPAFLARTPHGHGDATALECALGDAGFSRITIETVETDSVAPSPRHPAIAYCQGTPLRNELEARGPDMVERVTDAAADAIAARFGGGPVTGKVRGHVIVAEC